MGRTVIFKTIKRVSLIAILIAWGAFLALAKGDEEPGTVFCNTIVCDVK